ncbi:hypothetical protein HGM15179_009505 [Zosterops borbonicus]|uniref:Uncharacterized protein n=1 Tax=Zosterops borbonicus TaxID=364589 RepID=A0A8K1LL60_9PASS|nr:hypothetical protein HGM15179_009505 [Zosterops borbonicus]
MSGGYLVPDGPMGSSFTQLLLDVLSMQDDSRNTFPIPKPALAEPSQLSQPDSRAAPALVASSCLPLDLFQQVHILLMLGVPKLDTALQVHILLMLGIPKLDTALQVKSWTHLDHADPKCGQSQRKRVISDLGDSTERSSFLQDAQHLNSRAGSSSSKEDTCVEASLGKDSSSGQEILQKISPYKCNKLNPGSEQMCLE